MKKTRQLPKDWGQTQNRQELRGADNNVFKEREDSRVQNEKGRRKNRFLVFLPRNARWDKPTATAGYQITHLEHGVML